MAFILSLLFVGQSVLAGELCQHQKNQLEETASFFVNNLRSYDLGYAALPAQVQSPKCAKPIPSAAEIEKQLEKMTQVPDKKIYERSHGLNFIYDERKLLKAFDKLMTYNPSFMHKSKSHKVSSNCTKVLCAVKEIFGEEQGPKLLYLQMKYGINASHFASSNSTSVPIDEQSKALWIAPSKYRPPSNEELNDLIAVAQDMPPGLYPLSSDVHVVWSNFNELPKWLRNTGGLSDSFAFTYGKNVVMVTDAEPKMNKLGDRYTLFHELSHTIGNDIALDSDWKSLSSWQESFSWSGGRSFRIGNVKCAPSVYGMSEPREDFAESMVGYRYNPVPLKSACPEKYEFLKKHYFGGIEYINESDCAGKKISRPFWK